MVEMSTSSEAGPAPDTSAGQESQKPSVDGSFASTTAAPSLWAIKQLILDNYILPLGTATLADSLPSRMQSLLLFGPSGSGKSLLARAIATESASMFFDLSVSLLVSCLSPRSYQKFGEKSAGLSFAASSLIHKTFESAKINAPSVIYIDDVDQIFVASAYISAMNKKKTTKSAGKNDSDKLAADTSCDDNVTLLHAAGIKAELVAHLAHLRNSTAVSGTSANSASKQVIVVGCTSRPFAPHVDCTGLLGFFDESIFLSIPGSICRRALWKHFILRQLRQYRESQVPVDRTASRKQGQTAHQPDGGVTSPSDALGRKTSPAPRKPAAMAGTSSDEQRQVHHLDKDAEKHLTIQHRLNAELISFIDPFEFDLTTLVQISEGCMTASIERCVTTVLSPRRLAQLFDTRRPRRLVVSEFVGPLSRQPVLSAEQWRNFTAFAAVASNRPTSSADSGKKSKKKTTKGGKIKKK
eukprot:GHVT01002514.1.p1 GENE.GHVT01002514.1~~GHVT01002514.1.p1  ORF type:complete len:468 (-),score=38.63 GHVT01002514.1:3487-4890(-)